MPRAACPATLRLPARCVSLILVPSAQQAHLAYLQGPALENKGRPRVRFLNSQKVYMELTHCHLKYILPSSFHQNTSRAPCKARFRVKNFHPFRIACHKVTVSPVHCLLSLPLGWPCMACGCRDTPDRTARHHLRSLQVAILWQQAQG